MIDVALKCVARGWHVFPCWPGKKTPLISNGFKAAVNEESVIRAWWERWPDANVGIATGASGLTVLDIDKGVADVEGLRAFMLSHGIPETYAVRTGRRPAFGAQLYFKGGTLRSIAWDRETFHGDVRSSSGYVMAEGCLHPSGALYEALVESPISDEPAFVRGLQPVRLAAVAPGSMMKKIAEGGGRHDALARVAGSFRAMGFDGDAIYEQLVTANVAMNEVPVDDADLRTMADGFERRYPAGEIPPEVVIGKPKESTRRPRPQFLTLEDFDNADPPDFLIENFLLRDAMCMLAAPVAQRKTIVAMNVVHALCTGEPLFGRFKVLSRPRRIYYLCAEMGARSFCDRMRKLGIREYIGKTLFILTLNQPPIELEDLDELEDSVVVVDTLTRYVKGKESDSTDMRVFAARIMDMNRRGATMLLLHHSVKGSTGNLDGALRGSSELAAFVTSCWVTGLENPDDSHNSRSSMANVKQRDFEVSPYMLAAVKDSCRLVYAGESGPKVSVDKRAELTSKAESCAAALFAANPDITATALRKAVVAQGHKKGSDWAKLMLTKLRGTGGFMSESASK